MIENSPVPRDLTPELAQVDGADHADGGAREGATQDVAAIMGAAPTDKVDPRGSCTGRRLAARARRVQ